MGGHLLPTDLFYKGSGTATIHELGTNDQWAGAGNLDWLPRIQYWEFKVSVADRADRLAPADAAH